MKENPEVISFAKECFEYLKEHCLGRNLCTDDLIGMVAGDGREIPGSPMDIHNALFDIASRSRKYVMDFDCCSHEIIGYPDVCPFDFRLRTEKHKNWEGVVPFFSNGRKYLRWIMNGKWEWSVDDERYKAYFRELKCAVTPSGYDVPISQYKMAKALEQSQKTGEMIDIVPDPEFLPGGSRANQCDGWTYHIEFLYRDEYFKKRQDEEDLERAHRFCCRADWHFAKTMPQIPHWYCLLKECEDKDEFLWFARYVWEHSVPGEFYDRTYKYFYLGKYKYWIMDPSPEKCDLINRDEVK